MTRAVLEHVVDGAVASRVPLEVLFEVTHRCNLPCKHCYLPDHRDHGELSLDEIRALFDELAAAGTLFLTLTGGEVLSRRDFREIVDAAAARGFAIKILTNATLVSDEIARHWRDAGVLEVSVSVYGADAATHDAVTDLPGSFARTMAGIERLRAAGLTVALKTPLMTLNGDAARDVHALARAAGMPCRFDVTMTPKNDGGTGPLALQLAHDALADILSRAPFSAYASEGNVEGPSPCNAGRAYCAIGPTGDVMPCIMMPIAVGNVRTARFADVWREAPLLERLRRLTRADLHRCGTCDVKSACTRCPGLAWQRGQDVDGCDLSAKAVARARTSARLRVLNGAA